MLNRLLAVSAASFSLCIGACAHVPVSSNQQADRDVITFDQLEGVRSQSAFDAIRKVRPGFLVSRGSTSLMEASNSYATVYVDGVRYGSIDTLRQIPASWISEVKLLRVSSPGNLSTREVGGVISITTRTH